MGSSVAAVVIVVVVTIAEIYFEVKIEKNISTYVHKEQYQQAWNEFHTK